MDILVPELWSILEIAGKLLLAIVLGGLVGLEREVTHHAAGFRTHILVCVGAALVMMTGSFMYELYLGRADVDPTRLGAQVVSGIGFLGAGAILRDGMNIRGLTTAASLWIVAAIGLAVGSGFYTGAIAATAATYAALTLLRTFSARLEQKHGRIVMAGLRLTSESSALGEFTRLLSLHQVSIYRIQFDEQDAQSLTVQVRLPKALMPDAFIALLLQSPYIQAAFQR